MATWYYMTNQTDRIGPLDDSAMRAAVQSGRIVLDTLVFKTGETGWMRMCDVPDLVAMRKPVPSAVASRMAAFDPFPWQVGAIGRVGEGWGIEVAFEAANADEGRTLSRLIQQYHACAFQHLPRIASGSRQGSVAFVFPSGGETPVNVFTLSPLALNAVNAFRSYLGGVADTLRGGSLGIWGIDPRLAFFAEGEFHIVPSFWLPAFSARKTRYQGVADGWGGSGSQADADRYAIASACFYAATGKPYDPVARPLPGDIFPDAAQWNAVLGPVLRAALPVAVHDDPGAVGEQPLNLEQHQVTLSESAVASAPAMSETETDAGDAGLQNEISEEIRDEDEAAVSPEKNDRKLTRKFTEKRKNSFSKQKKSKGKAFKKSKDGGSKIGYVLACVLLVLLGVTVCWYFGLIPGSLLPNRYVFRKTPVADFASETASMKVPAVVNPDTVGLSRMYTVSLKISDGKENIWKSAKVDLENKKTGRKDDGNKKRQSESVRSVPRARKQVGADKNAELFRMLNSKYSREDLSALQELVDNGADVNAQTERGFTPVHIAVQCGDLRVLRWLKENGANLNIRDRVDMTPLDHAKGLGKAWKNVYSSDSYAPIIRWLESNGAQ